MGRPNPKIRGDTGQTGAIKVAQRNMATVIGSEIVKTKKFSGSNPMTMVMIKALLKNF